MTAKSDGERTKAGEGRPTTGVAGRPDIGFSLDPILRLQSVSKRFGTTVAVDNLSLDILPGEFFALLGPSGCGKSTVLRMIAGFEQPDSGSVMLDSVDVSGVPPHRRPVNMMFQSYALFPHMTVEKNIAFGLQQEGLRANDIRGRVEEALRLVRLEGLNRRKPHQLSGGQQQRVALARALIKRPKLLLLDEPLAALDKKLREETQFELVELQKRIGATFIIVTHDQEEAMTVATRIAVMERGRIAQIGSAAEVYERPASRSVAGFIGDINLLDGRVESVQHGIATVEVSGVGSLKVRAETGVEAGAEVTVAVRPEKLRLARKEPSDGFINPIHGNVLDVAYRGDFSIYKIDCGAGQIVKASMPNPMRSLTYPFQRGDEVWISWTPDAALLLTQ